MRVLKAINGLLQSILLFYKQLRIDLEGQGFVVNPYDLWVANRTVDGKQQTVTWHVDDLKGSHVDPVVNTRSTEWLESLYGDPKLETSKAVRGKRHDYLGRVLDYSDPRKVKIDMTDYAKKMVEEFP